MITQAGDPQLLTIPPRPDHTVRQAHPPRRRDHLRLEALEYQIEGQPPTTVKAGDVRFIPAGAVHTVRNVGSGNAAELATYVVEKASPSSPWSNEHQPSCKDHPLSGPGH